MNDALVKELGLNFEGIVKEIQLLSADIVSNRDALVKAFIRYDEASRVVKNASLWQFGLSPNQTLFELVGQGKQSQIMKEKAVREIARQYLDIFKPPREGSAGKRPTHNDQRELLESALKLLVNFEKEMDGKIEPATYALIAKTYLFRSAIMLPKGFTVPEKKKEALRKGLEFIRMIVNPDEEAMRIRGSLLLEQRHIDTQEKDSESNGDNQTLIKELREALENGCDKFNDEIEDVRIALYYIELTSDKKELLQRIIDSQLDFPGIELYRIKAYYLKGDYHAIGDEVLKKELSGIRFGHPVWSETMFFIEQLMDAEIACWRKLALAAYHVCRTRESEVSSLHLRWYWSGYRTLYDLAFMAADDLGKKAEIADSLKSRVALHAKAMDEIIKDDKEREAYYEAHAVAYAGGYVKGAGRIHAGERERDFKTNDVFRELPGDVALVTFYLNHSEKNKDSLGRGYALIAENGTWNIREFSFDNLYKAYLTWQTNYSRYKESASPYLVELCKEIGKAMPFLFEITKGKIVFVPHDFLHRLPLHGAIKEGRTEVLLEKHPCLYLPAWSLLHNDNTKSSVAKKRVLIECFHEYEYPELHKEINAQIEKGIVWEKKEKARPEQLLQIPEVPEILMILSHGKADMINPYYARLKLEDGDVSVLEILKTKPEIMNIKNSSVIMGCCETDLLPVLSTPIDEQLSLSAALYIRGVKFVVGTMWEVNPIDIEKNFIELLSKEDNSMLERVRNWQKEELLHNKWHTGQESRCFYQIVVFRGLGICTY